MAARVLPIALGAVGMLLLARPWHIQGGPSALAIAAPRVGSAAVPDPFAALYAARVIGAL